EPARDAAEDPDPGVRVPLGPVAADRTFPGGGTGPSTTRWRGVLVLGVSLRPVVVIEVRFVVRVLDRLVGRAVVFHRASAVPVGHCRPLFGAVLAGPAPALAGTSPVRLARSPLS